MLVLVNTFNLYEHNLIFSDGRKAAHVKDLLLRHYSEFLSDYAHNKLANYVTDINYDSIKVTLTYCGDLCEQIVFNRSFYSTVQLHVGRKR